ncbi:MAG TPA: thioesterase family protein [Magnetospirillaceae bacterium]|jgi:acyl-CoA thioester hydrolase
MKNTFTPPEDREVFQLDLEVRPEDIDMNGHVNNVIYVRWLQDVGTAHWLSRMTPQDRDPWSWVVVRHEIDYRAPLRLGEQARARTWVGTPHGPRFDRFVLIERGDGTLCAQGHTDWAMVDAKTMRPARITPAMIAAFIKDSSGT